MNTSGPGDGNADSDAHVDGVAIHHFDAEKLLHQHSYSVEEIAQLLDIGIHTIRRAVREGRLRAVTVGHDIVRIERSAVLDWLRQRG